MCPLLTPFKLICVSVDRTGVILVAQVFNGCLLPFFSTCLLLCLNDQQFMGTSPQPLWANLCLVTSVLITMFLANNAIIEKIFASLALTPRLGIAAGAAAVEIFLVCIFTSLGRDIRRSYRDLLQVLHPKDLQLQSQ